MRIEGSQFVIRTPEPRDRESLVLHANDRDIWINLMDRFPHPYTAKDADEFIAVAGRLAELNGREMAAGIEVEGELAGSIGVFPGSDVHARVASIGYWLGRRFQGRGIMTEAVGLWADRLFADPHWMRIEADAFGWNPASRRVLEKNGFVREGTRRNAVWKDGAATDAIVYGLLREDRKRGKDAT